MSAPLSLPLLGVLAALLLMMAASLAILRPRLPRDRFSARVARVTAAYRPPRGGGLAPAGAPPAGLALADLSEGLARGLARLFGVPPSTRDPQAARWWLALPVTLAAAAGLCWLGAGLLGPPFLLALPPTWVWLSRRVFAWRQARRRERLFRQFPDALAMIVRTVRVGIPVAEGLRAVGRELPAPTGPEFARVADELAIGAALETALHALAHRNDLREYHFFASALTLQSQTGGALGETLDNLADVIRKRVAVRQRGRALSAEAQTSALVLGLLPPLALVALWLMNRDYILVLFTDPLGRRILGLAAAGLGAGVLTMRALIRRSLT